nr:T9SS type A sorting domain-containing protein [Prevotella sp.]
SIAGQEVLKHDVILSGNTFSRGDVITLRPQNISGECVWQLFDASGHLVGTQKIPAAEIVNINTQMLTPGMYFYLLSGNNFRKTGKIVIR